MSMTQSRMMLLGVLRLQVVLMVFAGSGSTLDLVMESRHQSVF